jgi:hypothetical protein
MSSSESSSELMSEDSDTLLIETLELQVQDMILKNEELNKRIKCLEERIKTLQNISDSEIINKVFSYL